MNELGQRTALTTGGSAFATPPSIAWGYNARGEVTSAGHTDPSQSRFYQYDAIGNRQKSRAGTATDSGGTLVNYTANALNQYTAIGSTAPSYDPDGNQLTGQLPADPTKAADYVWDGENRLIEAKSNSLTAGSYQYDPFGRRIAKSAGERTWFIYDGWNPIAEYLHEEGGPPTAVSRVNLWGRDLSGSPQGAGGVGGLLATVLNRQTVEQSSFQAYYPTYDGNGNVSEYLAEDGTTAAHFEYDPFGKLTVENGDFHLFPIRFSTKYQDSETGLLYYGYRYYDAQQGRWMGRDPIEEEGGINLCAVLGNDVINDIDILGLAGENNPPSYLDGITDSDEARKAADKCAKSPADADRAMQQWEKAQGERDSSLTSKGGKAQEASKADPQKTEAGPQRGDQTRADQRRADAQANARQYLKDNRGTTTGQTPQGPVAPRAPSISQTLKGGGGGARMGGLMGLGSALEQPLKDWWKKQEQRRDHEKGMNSKLNCDCPRS